jgi:pimeloyl-ACP methyl ester carboxylesterase
MPRFTHAGYQLHYQTEGQGAPLVLHHGFTSSSQAWYYFKFVEALKDHFTVITFDALGHGKSDKPHHTDAYTLQQRTGAVLALLDTLQIEQTHYMGFSLGGWTGYGLVQQAPERIKSLILGGAHPYAEPIWNVFHGIDGQDPDAFVHAFETLLNETISPQMRMLVKANDLIALASAAQQTRPALPDVFNNLTMPALLFCGDKDQRYSLVQKTVQELPQAQFVSLPGVSHFSGVMHPELLVPQLLAFLHNQD